MEFKNTPYSLAQMNLGPVLYIARHGATGDDESYNGPENPDLNEHGVRNAYTLADYLSGLKTGSFISSAMNRAKQTADIVGRKLGKKVTLQPALDALDVGNVANAASKEEADKTIKHHQANPDTKIPGGESISGFRKRVRPEFIKSIKNFYKTGKPDVQFVHHSVQHEAGQYFNDDKDSALTEPGGLVAVYRTPNGYEARPIFKPE
jgi:glucosyl-3-phosphoglycerate phosphatase